MKKKKETSFTNEQQIIHDLSERIVKAQQPIRILDAIKWGPEVQVDFFKNKCKKLPKVDAEYYQKNILPYDPENKKEEFYTIERDIRSQLGQFSSVGLIMQRMCREYREVIRMIQARGTPEYSKISQELYGSAKDVFYAGAPTLKDLAVMMTDTLEHIQNKVDTQADEKSYTAPEAVKILNERLQHYFGDPSDHVRVKLSDGILADAAAGAECIKIRSSAHFSERDIRALEVHEGWVHLGTTLNGLAQPICTFLSKGLPSAIQTQEGLATVTEIFTFSSHPGRVRRLTDRILAADLAEQGGNFLTVFNFYLERGHTESQSYYDTLRVFRGSTPILGPFTKDLAYTKGFIFIYNYIRLAIQRGLLSRIPLLFVGKTTLEDLHILQDLQEEGIVVAPKFMPPQFKDPAALSAWMSYTLFLNKLNLQEMAAEYKQILHE
jgi:uncharacterized protein (TIGR02421 family)